MTTPASPLSTASTDQIVEVLDGAAAAILEHGWCQRKRRTSDGRMCLSAALSYAVRPSLAVPYGLDAIPEADERNLLIATSYHLRQEARLEPGQDITEWNDAKRRTVEQVIELLRATSRRVEGGRDEAS